MSFLENVLESLRSIRGNLLRTILTALIVSIGLFALVGILTGIDAMKSSLNSTFASLGANSFDLRAKGYSNRGRRDGVASKQYPPISLLQAREYKETMGDKGIVGISAYVGSATEVKAGGEKTNPNMRVVAGDENFLRIQSYALAEGRQFSQNELDNGTNVVVVGKEIKDKLFPGVSPLGQYVYFVGQRFRVVGVLASTGSTMGGSGADRVLFIPLKTGDQLPRQRALTYDVKTAVARPEAIRYAMSEAQGIMRAVRRDRLGQEDSFDLEGSDSVANKLDSISGNMKMGGSLIAIITLLGASIALMNIMLVSVTERTREIGIRKALGATSRQIRLQFLMEAIVICVIGGALGIVLGVLGGNAVSLFVGAGTFIVPWLWMTLGLTICVLVGLGSGYYPASKAAALDPIESLRFE